MAAVGVTGAVMDGAASMATGVATTVASMVVADTGAAVMAVVEVMAAVTVAAVTDDSRNGRIWPHTAVDLSLGAPSEIALLACGLFGLVVEFVSKN